MIDCVQLMYQSMQWTGQVTVEDKPASLSLATFETTKDGEKLTMVNRISCAVLCNVGTY